MEILGQFPGSQSGAGSDTVNNQLGAENSIQSNKDSRGIASYPPLSVGLGGSRADFEIMSKAIGSGANMPINPHVTDRADDEVQVNLSLLPSVPCSDRPSEHRQRPGPNPQPAVPPSTTPKQ